MEFLKTAALMGMLIGTVAIGCTSAQATPLDISVHKDVFTQISEESSLFLLQVQYRRDGRGPVRRQYPPRGHYDHGDDTGAAIAAGIFGLILGGIIAAEAQRQQSITYCAQRFRSYDPQSMTYLGNDGLRHPCP
jgi:hypothetical protein